MVRLTREALKSRKEALKLKTQKKSQKGKTPTVKQPKGKSPRGKKRAILTFLQTLKGLRPAQRTTILSHLDHESCEVLYETISNVLRNPDVTPSRRIRLRSVLSPHKNTLRFLSSKQRSLSSKKKRLPQMGGFPLAAILSAAIPLLLGLLRK